MATLSFSLRFEELCSPPKTIGVYRKPRKDGIALYRQTNTLYRALASKNMLGQRVKAS